MTIPILFEDENYLVVDKPAGLVVHADGRTKEPTLADWILEKYPAMKNVGEPWQTPAGDVVPRPGIVHRLDRETSGALVIAKNQEAFLDLKEQFQGRDVEKTYNAFVYGEMSEAVGDSGLIDRPIGKSRKDFRQWSAGRGARGASRPAVTEYKVLGKISANGEVHKSEQGFTYLEVRPKTGRTHQIRVHFKAVNHPVVHDKLYAPKHSARENRAEDGTADLGFERTALHARKLSFNDIHSGTNGKKITVEAPLPDDFNRALTFFQKSLKV